MQKLLSIKAASLRRMWIQGSREFVDQAIKLAKLFNISNYTCVIVEAKFVKGKLPAVDGVECSQLNHSRLGGLTHGALSSFVVWDLGQVIFVQGQ